MSKKQEQKITVRPDTLNNLVSSVEKGDFRVPQFQREFVWSTSKTMELFDSIYREYPIGSFFLWKAGKEHNKLFRHTVGLDIPAVGEHDDISFILDGQQRITSLYVTLKGLTVNGVDYSRIVFDLKEERFTNRSPDNSRYVTVRDIWGPTALKLGRQIPEEYVSVYDRCFEVLRTYPVSIVEVKDKDLSAVCKIFQRINQSGKRLDRFDLIAAMTFSPDFDVRERFKTDILAPLNAKHFGDISPVIVTQLLALLKDGQCTERHEFGLTTTDIKTRWATVVDAVLLAADTLRKVVGVKKAGYLPYDSIITLLSYYFARSGERSLPAAHMQWVMQWFWRSSFGLRYGAGGATRTGQDKLLFDQLIATQLPNIAIPLQLAMGDLIKVRMTQTGSALRNAFLCLLAVREPRNLVNNAKLDLINGGISDFTDAEKHHLFPQAYLRDHGPAGADVHSLPNFCFLPADLNKRISASDPATYISELQRENDAFAEAADSHLLPARAGSGLLENDYLMFLEARGKILLDEIRRLSGVKSTPRPSERQEAIETVEIMVRDLIDKTLWEECGHQYWKTRVPQDVRENVQKRIDADVEKDPTIKAADFATPRRRLDYCNVMDYATIIGNNANWPLFSVVFRKREELHRYLSGLSEYRNVIMHSRAMTELVETNGHAALIWFTSVLSENANVNDTVSVAE